MYYRTKRTMAISIMGVLIGLLIAFVVSFITNEPINNYNLVMMVLFYCTAMTITIFFVLYHVLSRRPVLESLLAIFPALYIAMLSYLSMTQNDGLYYHLQKTGFNSLDVLLVLAIIVVIWRILGIILNTKRP